MNKLVIIGNLTADPELRSTPSGVSVCTFTVAVNRRKRDGQQQEADFFRVSAWRELGENCSKFLMKGRKVAVVGSVSASAYQGRDGKSYASLEVNASEVEFLSPVGEVPKPEEPKVDQRSGMEQVDMDSELPF